MRIIRVGQMMDLQAGEFVSSFDVVLFDGRTATVVTEESTIQQLIRLAAGLPTEKEAVKAPVEEQYENDMPSEVFGEDPGEVSEVAEMGKLEDGEYPPEGTPQAQQIKPRGFVDADGFYRPPPPRTVEKDEMGYPIVSGRAQPQVSVEEDDGDQI